MLRYWDVGLLLVPFLLKKMDRVKSKVISVLFNILLMGESIILTAAIYRIMDWLLVQMTESYSETHNFTLRSARDDSRSSHIMVLLAQNLVNTHSLRGCAYLLSFLFWIRKKFFFRDLLAFILQIWNLGQLDIFIEETPWVINLRI